MKRTLLLILVLLGTSAIVNGQAIIRSGGVVRRTTNVVKIEQEEREKPAKKERNEGVVYEHEIGTFTHSGGLVLAYDEYGEVPFGLDYNIQYRFSPLFSAGAGAWLGAWNAFGGFGFEPRINGKVHPLATYMPNSEFQPYVALWIGTPIPRLEYKAAGYENGVDSFVLFSPEIGCDWYRDGRTWFASLTFNSYREYEWNSYYDSWSGNYYDDTNEWSIITCFLKVGLRF